MPEKNLQSPNHTRTNSSTVEVQLISTSSLQTCDHLLLSSSTATLQKHLFLLPSFFLSVFTSTLQYYHTNKNVQNLPMNTRSPLHTISAHFRDAMKQPDRVQHDTWSPTRYILSCHCYLPSCPHHHYLHGMLPDLGLI